MMSVDFKKNVSSTRLIILGLDGASWAVLDPLLEAGLLPNLRRIVAEGACATLNSIIPPVTGPAWPVLATGLNPGRLGTFDFQNRRNLEDFNLYPVNSDVIRDRSFWDVLSNKGYQLGIFGYPMLIPAYPINGWMVAGLGASKLHDWVWPPELAGELQSVADPYTISISYGLPKYHHNPGKLLADISRQVDGQLAALDYLLANYPVDVLVAVLGATDVLCHTMWHLWDRSHPEYKEDISAQLHPQVHAIWSKIDSGIAMLHQHLAPDGHFLLVSDHGFGPSHGVFHTNVWLQQNGFLHRKSGPLNINNRLRSFLYSSSREWISPFFKLMRGTRFQIALRESILREIDLEQTKAFALETTDVTGMIFINREYAYSRNLDEDQFVQKTTQEIRHRLSNYAQQHNLTIDTFTSEELYWGEYAHLAPELLFSIDDSKVSVSHKFASEIYQPRLHHPMKTGNHRQEGVFIAKGSKVKRNLKISTPLHLQDVAPTIYHLLGEPVPDQLDGDVARQILLPEHSGVSHVSSEDLPVSMSIDKINSSEEDPSHEDSSEMKQRLKDLGYLD